MYLLLLAYDRYPMNNQTLPRNLENGSALSLANDQIILEDVATKPSEAKNTLAMIILVRAIVPPTDSVAWKKIAMKGKPVSVVRIASGPTRLKSVASKTANPIAPFARMLKRIVLGRTVAALLISSAIWTAASAPVNENTLPKSPTMKERPMDEKLPPLFHPVNNSAAVT